MSCSCCVSNPKAEVHRLSKGGGEKGGGEHQRTDVIRRHSPLYIHATRKGFKCAARAFGREWQQPEGARVGGAHLVHRTSRGGRDSQREVLVPGETKSNRGERDGGCDAPAMLILPITHNCLERY